MNNLRKIRGKHALTLEEVGKQLGLTKAGVKYVEKSVITVKQAEKFAEFFNENIFDVMGSDVLKVLPKTNEDKKKLIDIIMSL